MQRSQAGLTFIEILLVLAILGILITLVLATITSSRHKAIANRVRSNISQIRILAEVAFDSNGGTYLNWAQDTGIQTEITRLLEKIDEDNGDDIAAPYVTVVREAQAQDYCVSAPLGTGASSYYCIDATGKFREVTSHCPDYDESDLPLRLRCPGN